jgi:transcription elongation GreA/GreB family factor
MVTLGGWMLGDLERVRRASEFVGAPQQTREHPPARGSSMPSEIHTIRPQSTQLTFARRRGANHQVRVTKTADGPRRTVCMCKSAEPTMEIGHSTNASFSHECRSTIRYEIVSDDMGGPQFGNAQHDLGSSNMKEARELVSHKSPSSSRLIQRKNNPACAEGIHLPRATSVRETAMINISRHRTRNRARRIQRR